MEMVIDKSTATNIVSSTDFKISNNSAKLFSMLSSFLYSNKELAVLHELSSNAVDAHKMIGKHCEPIEVHLPTSLSPNLIVKDSGPGLSPENVVKFLTTYGESDKADSNDFIGGYGIGSKSPAAVTDTWQIISKHAGKLHQYLIVVNNQGIPALTTLRETKTDETGLEVIVPVNPNTIHAWITSAKTAYEFYDVHPIIKGAEVIPQKRGEINHECLKFTVDNSARYGNNLIAVSGNRGYKIDTAQIKNHIDKKYSLLLGDCYNKITLPFGIGELEVDLSREKLRYSQHTIDALTQRINYVGDTIKNELHAKLKGVGYVDYLIIAAQYQKIYGSVIFEMIVGNPYNIKYSNDLHALRFNGLNPGDFKVAIRGKVATLSTKYTCGRTHAIQYSHDELFISLKYFDKIKFVLNDDKSTLNRVRKLTSESDNICLIADHFAGFDRDIRKRVIKGSSLPACPAATKGPRRATIKSPLYIKVGQRFLKIEESNIKARQAAGRSVYWTTITSATSADSDLNLKKTCFLGEFNDISPVIIAIKKGGVAPTWCKSVNEVFDDIISKYNADVSAHKENVKFDGLRSDIFFKYIGQLKDSLPDTSSVNILAKKIESWKRLDESLSALPGYKLRLLSNYIDLTTFKYSEIMNEIIEMYEFIKVVKYPMIELFASNQYNPTLQSEAVKKCVCYVNLVDDHFEEK